MNFEAGFVNEKDFDLFSDFLTENAIEDIKEGKDYLLMGVTGDGMAVGAIAGFMEYDDLFRITSFYVAPAFRDQGAGGLLFDTLLEGLKEADEMTALTMDFSEDGSDDIEALICFMVQRGYPESYSEGSEKDHRYTFTAV